MFNFNKIQTSIPSSEELENDSGLDFLNEYPDSIDVVDEPVDSIKEPDLDDLEAEEMSLDIEIEGDQDIINDGSIEDVSDSILGEKIA